MSTKTPGLTDSIADALFGATRQAVLRLLFGHVEERFYQRQIVREIGLGFGAVQRELQRLTACGILRRVVEGRQTYFQANPDCPVFDELRGLMRKTFGVADVVRAALSRLSAEIRVAFIFGSVAKAREASESDVDVMVIGDAVKPSDVYTAIRPTRHELRREVNAKVYQTEEFRRRLTEGRQFVTRVVEGPKIFVIGDERELKKLGKERLD